MRAPFAGYQRDGVSDSDVVYIHVLSRGGQRVQSPIGPLNDERLAMLCGNHIRPPPRRNNEERFQASFKSSQLYEEEKSA